MEHKETTDIIEAEFTENPENLPSIEVRDNQIDIEFEYARGNIIKIIEYKSVIIQPL